MTYKEKLLELHKISKDRLKDCLLYETKIRDQDEICDDICDVEHLDKRMQLYSRLQNAIEDRNQLAKWINENSIDVNAPYTYGPEELS
jgi:hypothetical protein